MSFVEKALLPLILLTQSSFVFAGIQIGATRVIYEEQRQDSVIKISNPDKTNNYLIQSWVESLSDAPSATDAIKKKSKSKVKSPFIVTPPLFSLSAGEENVLRIIHNGAALPADHESVFWLNIKSIPETEKKDSNTMVFSVKSTLKLIYRPEALSGDKATRAYQKIMFKKQGNQLVATNPTPYYLTFSSVKVDGKELVIKNKAMLAPVSSMTYDLGNSSSTATVSWTTLGDQGQTTPAETSKL